MSVEDVILEVKVHSLLTREGARRDEVYNRVRIAVHSYGSRSPLGRERGGLLQGNQRTVSPTGEIIDPSSMIEVPAIESFEEGIGRAISCLLRLRIECRKVERERRKKKKVKKKVKRKGA